MQQRRSIQSWVVETIVLLPLFLSLSFSFFWQPRGCIHTHTNYFSFLYVHHFPCLNASEDLYLYFFFFKSSARELPLITSGIITCKNARLFVPGNLITKASTLFFFFFVKAD